MNLIGIIIIIAASGSILLLLNILIDTFRAHGAAIMVGFMGTDQDRIILAKQVEEMVTDPLTPPARVLAFTYWSVGIAILAIMGLAFAAIHLFGG